MTIVSKLEPPKRQPVYKEYDSNTAVKSFSGNVQKLWWKSNEAVCKPNSTHQSANFCEYWNQLLARVSYNYIKAEQISTISEYCLLREILWMFVKPCNTKFFHLDGERVVLNKNVSIPSVTTKGLQSFLKEFTEKMTILNILRQFCQKVQGTPKNSHPPPHTMEAYADELTHCLSIVLNAVLEKEKNVMQQELGTVDSILELHHYMQPHFKFLEHLWDIHRFSVIDWHKYPNHVCAAHLLAGLFLRIRKSSSSEKAALATSLYLKTIRVYLSIVDGWWNDGRLDDWRQEFLIQGNFFSNKVLNEG